VRDACDESAQLLFFSAVEHGVGDHAGVEFAGQDVFDVLGLGDVVDLDVGQALPVAGGVFIDELGVFV